MEQTPLQRKNTYAATAALMPSADIGPITATATPTPNIGPVTAVPTPALTVPTPQSLASQANAEASQLFEQTKDRDIDIRDSAKIIREAATRFTETTTPPKPESLKDLFTQERSRLGLEPLESEMANLDSEIDRLNVQAFGEMDQSSDRFASRRSKSLEQQKIGKDAERQLALLNVERGAVARQIDNKLSALKMTMDFTQQDFTNASAYYKDNFDRNMKTIDLFMDLEDREITAADKLKSNAIANLQTIFSAVSESGGSFDTLTPEQQRNIGQMELQAGLPMGFYASLPPQTKVLSTTTRENNGVKYADVLTRDPKTGEMKVETRTLGGSEEGALRNELLKEELLKTRTEREILEASLNGDGTGTIPVDPKEARQINNEMAGTDEFKAVRKGQDVLTALTQFADAFGEEGLATLPSSDKAALEAKYNAAVLQAKEFFNLGVLNGPDLEIIKGVLPSPTDGSFKLFRGRKGGVEKGLENLKVMIEGTLDDRYASLRTRYGSYNPNQVTGLNDLDRVYVQQKAAINPRVQDLINENPDLPVSDLIKIINTKLSL